MKFSAPHRGWTSGRAKPSLRPNPYAAKTSTPAGRHLSFAEICVDNRSQLSGVEADDTLAWNVDPPTRAGHSDRGRRGEKKSPMRGWRTGSLIVALTLASLGIASFSLPSQAANQDSRKQASEDHKLTKTNGASRRPKPSGDNKLPVGLYQALYLIRSTLLTLNDANRSGNYTVLRDLASPGVQARYTPADLAQIFSGLRENHVDLSAVALAAPQLSGPPKLELHGDLRVTGYFPTQPRQINFNLQFQIVAGHWRWLELSVTTPDAPASAQTSNRK